MRYFELAGLQKFFESSHRYLISYLWLFILLITPLNVSSQETANLYVTDIEASLEFIRDIPESYDVNGKLAAGLLVVSDLPGLSYSANNGMVKDFVRRGEGEDLLYLSPNESMITIYNEGYKPFELILADNGIKLESGKVWKVEITGDKKADEIPINFITEPAGASVYINGEDKGKIVSQKLPVGSHIIKLENQGYRTITDTIDVTAEGNTLFQYTFTKIELVRVTIRTNPEEASVFWNNVDKGLSPAQFFEIPGQFNLKITKAGYIDIEEVVKVSETGTNEFVYNLTKNTGTITFNLTPTDATIKINNQIYTGPEVELQPGAHQIEIFKAGYLPVRESVTINRGENISKTISLIKNSSPLTINVTPDDASVLINRENYTGQKQVELAPGKYQIEVAKDGYYPQSEMIEIELNKPLTKTYKLEQKFGELQFTVKPIDASVTLSKDGNVKKRWTGANYLKDLPVGTYNIEASFSGYKITTRRVTITENNATIENINLEAADSPIVNKDEKFSDEVVKESSSFSRSGAVLQSVLIPGLGQVTNGSGRGWIYTAAAIGAGIFYYTTLSTHNDNVAKYNDLYKTYSNDINAENEAAAREAYNKADESLSTTYIALGVIAAVYVINFIDVLSFDPPENNLIGKTEISPSVKLVNQQDLQYGFNLRIEF